MPKYIALYEQMKAEILSGKYPTGSFLPVENKLMELYDASRTTIRHAIAMLKEEHLLEVKQGQGTRVLPVSVIPNDFKKFRNYDSIEVGFKVDGEIKISAIGSVVDIVTAESKVAKALQIEVGTKVYRLQKLQAIDNKPFAYMLHYLRSDLLPGLEKYSGQISNLANFVKSIYGITITSSTETISALLSGFIDSQMLNIEINSPLMSFNRISYVEDEPIEYGETVIRPDMFEVVVKMNGRSSFMDHQ